METEGSHKVSKRRVWPLIAGLAGVLAIALIAAGCLQGGGTADKEDKKQSKVNASELKGVPKRTESAELVAPPAVPKPINRSEPALVKVKLETTEIEAELDKGVKTKLWTFNGTVPGPMLRVREGDMVELTMKNADDSAMVHSVDLHAVNGPGGGAVATQMAPGKEGTFRFRALNPGLYVYHCASPLIPEHVARGMYGLILVEPQEGMPEADKEFYVMQGDFYIPEGAAAKSGAGIDLNRLKDENPSHVLFNGKVGSLADANALKANVGDKVRIYWGVGGPNLTSSFHVIGEIFDSVHPDGASEASTNIQTTMVPAGGATWVDFKVNVPATYLLVDHSLGRLLKGAVGQLVVEGDQDHNVYEPGEGASGGEGGH